ncbi:MAG: phenylalanine--tRNA ligase beta subunit-related protein [Candidatus Bathyarchaeota archaeon]|nr:phenylalanine--tRNA ligase beta subunit-related protein [Candidatus Bathyarchaeota archaeon]
MGCASDMEISVEWSLEIQKNFSNLSVCIGDIRDIHVEKHNTVLEDLKKTVYDEVKASYNIENLKDNPTVRAYRDFYWKLGMDPTKIRPSGEALLRRVLNGNELPNISTAVDAYNLASLKMIIPISGFDKNALQPPLKVRQSQDGESFKGIGMDKPVSLTGSMLVLVDMEKVLCIYPYRDSDHSKITAATRDAVILGYGAPNVPETKLVQAVETALNYIKQTSSGQIGSVKVFSLSPK